MKLQFNPNLDYPKQTIVPVKVLFLYIKSPKNLHNAGIDEIVSV